MCVVLLVAGCDPAPTATTDTRGGINGTGGVSSPTPPPVPTEVLTHCGLEFLRHEGKIWRAEQPLPEPKPLPRSQVNNGYTSGTITLVDERTLHFAVDTTRYEGPKEPVVFRPSSAEPPLCQ